MGCIGTCAIAEVWNKLALEINSKTDTTKAMIKKRRVMETSWNNDCSLRYLTAILFSLFAAPINGHRYSLQFIYYLSLFRALELLCSFEYL